MMASAQTIHESFTIGQRIALEHFRGTIRYLGPVTPTPGEWIGVEWDDVERGKHSGEHQGVQYFQCLFPGTASFTRLSDKIDSGKGLLDILKERYISEDQIDPKDLFVGDSKLRVRVEVFDFERVQIRQKHLHLMTVVGLANTNICKASDPEETRIACQRIEDLDLSSTLISTWTDLAQICEPLERLRTLRASRNRFMPLTSQPEFGNAFRNLECLAVNRVYLSWDEMELLEPSLPNLKILQIGFNGFTELGRTFASSSTLPKINGFLQLQQLHLEGNQLQDWSQIMRLSHLPKLETLDLSENRIQRILGPNDKKRDFPALKNLWLDQNLIEDWPSMDQLGAYAALETLSMGGNPLMAVNEKQEVQQGAGSAPVGRIDATTWTIAKMGGLQKLNNSEITEKDRTSAEMYYLLQVGMATKGMSPEAIAELHPRYAQLCQVHGAPDISDEYVKATSEILKDRLINIRIVIKDRLDGPEKSAFERGILGTMKVKNLKNLIQKLSKVLAVKQDLVFKVPDRDYADQFITVDMKDDMREISFYDLADGYEIIVLERS